MVNPLGPSDRRRLAALPETEKAVLARKLCEARLDIALREHGDLLARADSPSAAVH
jgi:hypothetical protein